MNNAFIINERDDVVIVTEQVAEGSQVVYRAGEEEVSVLALNNIPKYHKVAVREVKKGAPVIKYGEVIGYALCDIHVGEHVHVQNVDDFPEEVK